MTSSITQEDLAAYEKAKRVVGGFESKIFDRITSVIETMMSAFGYDPKRSTFTWYFSDAQEGEVGTFHSYGGEIEYCLDCSCLVLANGESAGRDAKMKTESGNYFELFPEKFLFMSNDEIRDFLLKEIELSEKKRLADLERKKEVSAEKEKLRQEALQKLSPSEKRALGIKE